MIKIKRHITKTVEELIEEHMLLGKSHYDTAKKLESLLDLYKKTGKVSKDLEPWLIGKVPEYTEKQDGR